MLAISTLMLTLGLTVGMVAALMAAMAVGVIFSDRRLAGSCGGKDADCLCEKKARGECTRDHHPDAGPALVAGSALARRSSR
ncbi:MAG: hypothetical protein JKY37_10035 [Nannocystaceae bacterium]|nr:hypothetical protein [Nannocystaceae bacterium]